jgi:hypothetical protein
MFATATEHKRIYVLPPCDWKGKECADNHLMKNCPRFLKLNEEARQRHLEKKGRCILCFKDTHTIKECPHVGKRHCQKCKKDHHTLLHRVQRQPDGTLLLNAGNPAFSLFTTPIGVALQGKETFFQTNAIIDNGASMTLMSQELANNLGVTGAHTSLSLTTIGEEYTTTAIQTKVAVRNTQTDEPMGDIEVRIIPEFPRIKAVDWSLIWNDFPHLKDVRPPCPAADGVCHLIIGNNNVHLTGSVGSDTMVLGNADLPIAKTTPLGVSIGGRTSPKSTDVTLGWAQNTAVYGETKKLSQAFSQAFQGSD